MYLSFKSDTNKNIKEIVKKYNFYFEEIKKAINLPDKWEKNNSLEIEIKKSFIRGLLRYSSITSEIRFEIIKNFKQNFSNKKKLNWITLPYPMIHLAGDEVEDGGFHVDGHDENTLLTCWIPISEYKYPALSAFKKFWLSNKLISFIIKLYPNIKKIAYKIQTNQGDIHFWDGNFFHSGNLNTSSQTSCAIQCKLSNKIYDFEQSQNIDKNMNITFKNLNSIEIKKLYSKYSSSILELNSNHKSQSLFDNAIKFSKELDGKSLIISFSVSVLSQRLLSKKKLFDKKYTTSEFIKNLDTCSIILGSSNLICLKRLLDQNAKKEKFIENLKKYDFYKCIPFESYQFKKIATNKSYLINSNYFSY